MADQIVTLIDNEGTNLYPVAGALKQGSVTTSTINDGAVTAAKVDFLSFGCGNYTTAETDTGFTWIDGKHIYKKTISIPNLPSSAGNMTVAHGISNLGLIIKIDGTYHDTNDYTFPVNMPINQSSTTTSIRTIVNGSDIQVSVGQNRSECTGYVTLYYTKTS